MILTGRATTAGTQRYFDRIRRSSPDVRDPHWFRYPAGIGLHVSRLGFGTYRTNRDQEDHHEALREALLTGTNVIDTAANYSDGSAQILVGNVLQELVTANRLDRDEVVLIDKVGFIEGTSRHLLLDRMPEETTEISPSLFHCIHPDFIEMQFEWSRQTLGVDAIDVFLLQNPEVCLASVSEREYYRRLRNAFLHLEDLRSRGLLSFYGISSNDLVTGDGPHHLEAMLSFAPPGFRVIQFPANLLETGHRDGLLHQARRRELWTLGQRPLNALVDSKIVRLARMVDPPAPGSDSPEARQIGMEEELKQLEATMLNLCDGSFAFQERWPSAADTLRHYRGRIPGPDNIYPLIHALTPPLQQTISRLKIALDLSADPKLGKLLFERYSRLMHSALGCFPACCAFQNHVRMERIERAAQKGTGFAVPLSVLAVQAMLADGLDTVLVGMRRVSYVRQLHDVATLPVLRKIGRIPESLLPDRSTALE